MSQSFSSRPHWGRGVFTCVCTALALAACGTTSRSSNESTPGAPLPPQNPPAVSPESQADQESAPTLTSLPSQQTPKPIAAAEAAPLSWVNPVPVETILTRIRERHPSAAAARAAIQAADASVVQARAWDNPEVELTARSVKGRGTDESDTPMELKITQPLGTYGERSYRTAAARADVLAVQADTESTLRELDRVAAQTLLRFMLEVESLALAQEQLRVADEILTASERLAQAGEISQADVARARAAQAQVEANRDIHISLRENAHEQVYLLLGEPLPDDAQFSGIWVETVENTTANAAVGDHPALRAIQARMDAALQRLHAERAGRGPQWSVGVEATRSDNADEVGLILGFSVPVWNRNAGGIAAAEAARTQARADSDALRLRLMQETAEVRSRLIQAIAEQRSLTAKVVPAAREALRLHQEEYAAGMADLPAVLDSQRAVIDVESQILTSRQRAAEAVIDLHALLNGFAAPSNP